MELLEDFGHEFGRILDSAKLTPGQASKRWNISLEEIQNVLHGSNPPSRELERAIDGHAPLYSGDLYVPEARRYIPFIDNTLEGVATCLAEESDSTRRSLFRKWFKEQKEGARFHIYDYADTAVARHSKTTILPERIWEYLVIPEGLEDALPSGAMNNGHFEQQMTLFVGPVTVYYERLDGQIDHVHMETGDMEYHLPFVPHTFTKRTSEEEGLILATTFRGELGNRNFLNKAKAMSEDAYLDRVYNFKNTLETDWFQFQEGGYMFQKNAKAKIEKKGNYLIRRLLDVPYQLGTSAFEYSFAKKTSENNLDILTMAEHWGYVFDAPITLHWGESNVQTLQPGSSYFVKTSTPYSLRPIEKKKGRIAILQVNPGVENPWHTAALTMHYAGEQGALRIRSNDVRWST